MRLSSIVAGALAVLAVSSVPFARADESLDQEIAEAKQKFCSGLSVTAPTQGQQFADPTQVRLTVERQPDEQAKTLRGVDIYSISNDGTPKYLGTPWEDIYNLNTKASLPVDITKVEGTDAATQYRFRVWVRNEQGPDCTLMSKVFRVAASHTNDASYAMQSLDGKIDRGCFGIDLTAPAIGKKLKASDGPIKVNIKRDPISGVSEYRSIELYKYHSDTKEAELVHKSWDKKTEASELFTFKDTLDQGVTSDDDEPFFYKLTAVTEDGKDCEFSSHPFYYQ
ncbi:hypothetical protein BDB00DRAFT_809709 [Zychaea mexicana]|uniref:uncharacterized protein n=1 Tax=Zychaea mexicana TaxID=64656 RepID=UPI0022FE1A1B|nr:uncharacterized protein BDB00DRAFT_809709 [Zychaea mexicana]KAI9496263.1 hypothetical protein BDB00DRAFT_809709 [Zychaea mexicana]